MTDTHDEWTIPQAAQPQTVTRQASRRPMLFHDHNGEKYVFPFSVFAVTDSALAHLSQEELNEITVTPERISLIIGADDDKLDLVQRILNEYADRVEDNACITTIPMAAPYFERAVAIADSQFGMRLTIGAHLRLVAKPAAKDAAETLFQAIANLRAKEELRTPACI